LTFGSSNDTPILWYKNENEKGNFRSKCGERRKIGILAEIMLQELKTI
jgi:hypothetical protein